MTNVVAGGTTGFILGGLLGAGMQAGCGAAAGAVGAAILDSAGYKDYSVSEAAQMGAIGNAVVGAAVGATYGAVIGCVAGMNDKDEKEKRHSFFGQAVGYVGTQTAGGILGWAIVNANTATVMSLAKTAAALATGAAVTMFPATCITTCIAFPILAAGIVCAAASMNEKEVESPAMSV